MENQKTLFLLGLGIVGVGLMANQSKASELPNTGFNRWDSLFKKYSQQFSVPWRWIKAVAIIESNLGEARSVKRGLDVPTDIEGSKSSDGKSWGIMQLTLPTANDLRPNTKVQDLNNPEISIELGAKYLGQMIKRFGIKDRESVIRAYNGGPGFRSTVLGQSMTPVYYSKFQGALNRVLKNNPGNEMEIG